MKNFLLFFLLTIPYLGTSQNEVIFRADVNQLMNEKTSLPRFSAELKTEKTALFPNLGFWGLIEMSEPVVKKEWIAKGYTLNENPNHFRVNDHYNLGVNLGLTSKVNSQKFDELTYMLGFGVRFPTNCLGPTAGLSFKKDRISFEGIGFWAVTSAYEKKYSNTFEVLPIIQGFDPNSWWKISLSYSKNENSKIGIISERFYLTGPFLECKLSEKIRISTTVGWNILQQKFGFSLSILNLF